MTTTARAALLAVVALLATGLLLVSPAVAADAEVRLTADGPVPAEVALPTGGGTVRFVVDDVLSHTLVSDAFPEQRLGGLGQPQQVELTFQSAADFTDRRNRPLAPQEEPGRVTVTASPPAAQPAPGTQAPAPSRAPVAVRRTSTPQSGSDAVQRSADSSSSRTQEDDDGAQSAPPASPLLPLDLQALADPAADPDDDAVSAAAALQPVQAVAGPLPGEPSSRGLGLPAALAVLASLGVASLIVRVLLAEPAARTR